MNLRSSFELLRVVLIKIFGSFDVPKLTMSSGLSGENL